MGGYLPSTEEERRQMLDVIGVKSVDELFGDIPANLKDVNIDLPAGKSEMEVRRIMEGLAAKNTVFKSIFRGVGAYNHYIPAIVKAVIAKEEFLTAYTPYQAEISQGILQSIFEYQTMICDLTGMAVANASVYDGATAAAEAVAVCRDKKHLRVLVAQTAHPHTITTIRTYCDSVGAEVVIVPAKDGHTDKEALASLATDGTACFYLQQPNFYGLLEDAEALGEITHSAGAKYIMGCNPIALAIIKTPAECRADLAVGEGQPLGLPLSFGGPYLGYMACTPELMRKMPGRIVGETTDIRGGRAFVLTMQAREQHIRREKATSNICSNQALCALAAAVYLATLGSEGIVEVADQCHAKAVYAQKTICAIDGFELKYDGPFFNEFVTTCPVDPDRLLKALADQGILGGYPTDGGLIWCVTETNSKDDIDALAAAIKEVCGK